MAGPALAERIEAGLVAFAVGDALGAPYEGQGPRELPRARHLVPGATTDDTQQLLLAAEVLCDLGADAPGQEVAGAFLERLAADVHPRTGPSTLAALAAWRAGGGIVARGGTTNGPLMRAPAVGWAISDPARRREVALALGRATHGWQAAMAGALVAELAAWALEGRVLRHAVADTADGWRLSRRGTAMGARETYEALANVLHRHDNPTKALQAAVKMGGDTDTVAAIAGGILGVRDPRAVGKLPWRDAVALPDGLDALAARLAALREG